VRCVKDACTLDRREKLALNYDLERLLIVVGTAMRMLRALE